MIKNEILIAIMDLLSAMEENNLEETKKLVDFLNNNFIPSEEMQNYDKFIPIYDLYNSNVFNESYIYVIYNLNYVSSSEELKWNLITNDLIAKNNKDEILNFIYKILSEKYMSNYQLNSVMRLCVKLNRYDILKEIR